MKLFGEIRIGDFFLLEENDGRLFLFKKVSDNKGVRAHLHGFTRNEIRLDWAIAINFHESTLVRELTN